MFKTSFYGAFLLAIMGGGHVSAESAIPREVKQILSDRDKTDKAKNRVEVARKVKIHLEKVLKLSMDVGDKSAKNTVLVVAEYLCPHCHNFLKGIKDVKLKEKNVKFSILALPVFDTKTSKEYGVIMQHVYQTKPEKFLNVLADYVRNNKDELLKLVREDYKIDLADGAINSVQGYKDHEKLLDDLGIPFAPMIFYVMSDKDKKNPLVIPLMNVSAKRLLNIVDKLEKLDEESIQYIKAELRQ